MVFAGVCWCLLVADDVVKCPIVSGDVRRESEEFLLGYMSALYGRIYGLGSSEGASECSGLV